MAPGKKQLRALVTGSSGFVGSHLVEALLAAGHKVRVLLRPQSKPAFLQNLPVEQAHAAYDNQRSLKKALQDCDLVFHVGGVTKACTREGFIQGNAQTTANLLQAASALKQQPQRFVLVSSLAAAGPAADRKHPLTEEQPPHPVESYGLSKLSAELVACRFSHHIPLTIVRPPIVYGPRDVDGLALFRILCRGFNPFYGNSRFLISVIHVRDLVQGMLQAALNPAAAGRTYFLTNKDPVTWREYQNTIKQVCSKKALPLYLPRCMPWLVAFFGELKMKLTKKPVLLSRQKVRMGMQRYWNCSGARAARELRFSPRISLEQGLAETETWYRENGWL